MAVFPHHTRANEWCRLAGHAASRVVPGTLQDHRAFPCNGILRRPRRLLWVCDPARRSGRGATFAPKSRIGDVWMREHRHPALVEQFTLLEGALSILRLGGRDGIRTHDLLVANGESLKLRRVAT